MSVDKLLLILDLDETLIHATETELNYPADFQIFHYFVYLRPFLNDFLAEISQHFQLGIWSSASDDYVKAIVEKIIPADIPLAFIWGRSRCTSAINHIFKFQDANPNYYATGHYAYYKKLKKVKRLGFDLKKTLIVDDSPQKLIHNYGNAIYIQEFKGEMADKELIYLAKYLFTLKELTNVLRLEKRGWRNIFS